MQVKETEQALSVGERKTAEQEKTATKQVEPGRKKASGHIREQEAGQGESPLKQENVTKVQKKASAEGKVREGKAAEPQKASGPGLAAEGGQVKVKARPEKGLKTVSIAEEGREAELADGGKKQNKVAGEVGQGEKRGQEKPSGRGGGEAKQGKASGQGRATDATAQEKIKNAEKQSKQEVKKASTNKVIHFSWILHAFCIIIILAISFPTETT